MLFASRQHLSKVKIQVGENVYVDCKSSVFATGDTLLTSASFPRHAANRDGYPRGQHSLTPPKNPPAR